MSFSAHVLHASGTVLVILERKKNEINGDTQVFLCELMCSVGRSEQWVKTNTKPSDDPTHARVTV